MGKKYFKVKYNDISPTISSTAYVAPTAAVIGNVTLGHESSLWFGVVARGDVNRIVIGERSNIQDGTIIHVSSDDHPTLIGNDVTIGHMAVIHACTLRDRAFIGIKACILDGAVVESDAMVGAGALVTPGKIVRSGELWTGVPAKSARKLNTEEIEHMRWIAKLYVKLSREYLE